MPWQAFHSRCLLFALPFVRLPKLLCFRFLFCHFLACPFPAQITCLSFPLYNIYLSIFFFFNLYSLKASPLLSRLGCAWGKTNLFIPLFFLIYNSETSRIYSASSTHQCVWEDGMDRSLWTEFTIFLPCECETILLAIETISILNVRQFSCQRAFAGVKWGVLVWILSL